MRGSSFSLIAMLALGLWLLPTGQGRATVSSWAYPGLDAGLDAGIRLVRDHGCLNCHRAPSPEVAAWLRPLEAPALTTVGSRLLPSFIERRLSNPYAVDPQSRMPHILHGFDVQGGRESITDLVQFLVSRGGPIDTSAAALDGAWFKEGEALYQSIGCAACHEPDEPAIVDQSRRTTLAGLSQRLMTATEVHRSGRMPALGLEVTEAKAIAAWLLRDQGNGADGKPLMDVASGVHYEAYELKVHSVLDFDDHTPVESGTASKISVDPRTRNEYFGLRFTGELEIPVSGEHTFGLWSDDGSRLWIDGVEVIENDGDHAPSEKKGKATLEAGWHPFEVRMYEFGGGEHLEFRWQVAGSGTYGEVPPSAMRSVTRVLRPPEEPFSLDPDRVKRGKVLYQMLNCISCHDGPGIARTPLAELKPARTGCLSENPAIVVPAYRFNAEEKDAIIEVLRLASEPTAMPTPAEGVSLRVGDIGCTSCHSLDGRWGPDAEHARLFTGTAELGDEGRLPPPLTGVGGKLKPDWLKKVIANGESVRPYMVTRMPHYGDERAEELAQLFIAAGADAHDNVGPTFTIESQRAGHQLVGTDGFRCIDCHNFSGHHSLGEPALDLADTTDRLQPGWYRQYMFDPQSKRQGTRMPAYWAEGIELFPDLLGGDPTRQIDATWTYLSGGESAPLPKGLIVDRGSFDVVPSAEEPAMTGIFLRGHSARTIAVGYPERVSIAFDVENIRMALAWRGDFINAQGTWQGRAGALEVPAGTSVISMPGGMAVALLERPDAIWPLGDAREGGWRFKGYRRDEARRPIFRYQKGSVEISEVSIPQMTAEGTNLLRVFDIRGNENSDGVQLRLARDKTIRPAGNHRWQVGDQLFITVDGAPTRLLTVDGEQELRVTVPAGGATIEEVIQW